MAPATLTSTIRSVGGTARGNGMMMNEQRKPIFFARSFSLALWLVGKGCRPIRCETARDSGNVMWAFVAREVEPIIEEYHQAKAALEELSRSRAF